MENVLAYICEHAQHAHWILFSMLILTGFNIPLSEDVILLTAGVIAGSCIPDHTLSLYLWIFCGCIFSAWIAYWIGRELGPKLYRIHWFSRIITPERIERLQTYYEKYGILVFIVGRFCPGGVRNTLFMTSGLGKMPFGLFVMRDTFACLISSSTLYYLGFQFGENHDILFKYFRKYELIVGVLIVIVVISLFTYFIRAKRNN